jgi:hypothetical protein
MPIISFSPKNKISFFTSILMDMQYETSKSNALHFIISGKLQSLDIGLLKKCIEDRKHVHSLDIQRSVALQVKKSFLKLIPSFIPNVTKFFEQIFTFWLPSPHHFVNVFLKIFESDNKIGC